VTATGGWAGGAVTPRASCVLAPNPGPMTLDGTNTWVLVEPGADLAVVVDPGPDEPAHLRAVLADVRARGARVSQVLLTHGHADHSAGAASFAALAGGVPVRALDPAHRLGAEGLAGGDELVAGGLRLEVVATPGHTSDSLSFLLPQDGAVLTGDTVLGRGTTVVAHPDGRLGDYLGSLQLLGRLTSTGAVRTVLPGHGPALGDAAAAVGGYLEHRRARLRQVADAVAAGASTPADVVARVYAGVDPALWAAAELSVRAQLQHLAQEAGQHER